MRRSRLRNAALVLSTVTVVALATVQVGIRAAMAGVDPVTMTVSASTAAPGPNTLVTFTAVLSGASSAPTGVVTFYDAGVELGCLGVTLNAVSPTSSEAICGPTGVTQSSGSQPIVALYSGDTTYASAAASTTVEAVGISTGVALSSSSTVVQPGISVTFSAAVTTTGSSSTPVTSGGVTFEDNGTPLACSSSGAQPVNASGVTTCTASFPATGTQVIGAIYADSSATYASSATAIPEAVVAGAGSLLPSQATLSVSTPTPAKGEPITLSATVSSSASSLHGGLDGPVTFTDNGTPIAGCTDLPIDLVSGAIAGAASCTDSSGLASGTQALNAVYLGNSVYAPSASADVPADVGLAPTSLALAASPDPFASGSTVTFTASVSGATSGYVAFDATSGILCPMMAVTSSGADSGTATCSASLSASDEVTASFFTTSASSGLGASAASIAASTSASPSSAPTPAMLLSATPSPAGANGDLTLTVTLSAAGGTTPVTSGTVTFFENGTSLSCAPGSTTTVTSAGTATCLLLAPSSTGSVSFSAIYGGSASYATATASTTILVEATGSASTFLDLTASPASPTVGAHITYAVSVTASGATPSGMVTLSGAGTGVTACGSGGALALSDGTASCTLVAPSSPGVYPLVASYGGSATFAPASSLLALIVNAAPPASTSGGTTGGTTSEASSPAPSSGPSGTSTGPGGSFAPPSTTNTGAGGAGGGNSGGAGAGRANAPSSPAGAPTPPLSPPFGKARPARLTFRLSAATVVNRRVVYRLVLRGGERANAGRVTFMVNGIAIHGCTQIAVGGTGTVSCTLPHGFVSAGQRIVSVSYAASNTRTTLRRVETVLPPWHGLWAVGATTPALALGGARAFPPHRRPPNRHLLPARAGKPVAVARTPDAAGYWVLTSTGHVYGFGDAHLRGNGPARFGPYVAIAPSFNARGYFLLSASGRVVARGDARARAERTRRPAQTAAVDLARTPDGAGYLVLHRDGAVRAFGDAHDLGNGPARFAPYVAIAPTLDANGYWLLSASGHVIARGDARALGSARASARTGAFVAMAETGDAAGYWLLSAHGQLFAFGNARHALGRRQGTVIGHGIVAIAGI